MRCGPRILRAPKTTSVPSRLRRYLERFIWAPRSRRRQEDHRRRTHQSPGNLIIPARPFNSPQSGSKTSAPPPRVWEFFSDVAGWKDWNAGIERTEIHGPFATGTTFTMQPPGQDALTSTLIEVKPNESFTDETVVGETRVLVSHQLVQLPSGRTKIIYRTEITGPGAEEFGPIVTADFPDAHAVRKKLCTGARRRSIGSFPSRGACTARRDRSNSPVFPQVLKHPRCVRSHPILPVPQA